MSARMEVEIKDWKQIDRNLLDLSAVEMESLMENMDQRNVVKPLREAHAALARNEFFHGEGGEQRKAALELQEQWNAWLAKREMLREEIKRGKEFLEKVRRDALATRTRMED